MLCMDIILLDLLLTSYLRIEIKDFVRNKLFEQRQKPMYKQIKHWRCFDVLNMILSYSAV